MKLRQRYPGLKRWIIFFVVVLFFSSITAFRHPNYILQGATPGAFSLLSKVSFYILYNIAGIIILYSFWLGALIFLLYKMIEWLKRRNSIKYIIIKNKKQILTFVSIILGITAVSVLLEFVICLIFDKSFNTLGTHFNKYRFLFIYGIFLNALVFLLYIKKIIFRIEKLFLISILIIGSIFCISMPATTNVSWDDQIHYKNAVATSFPATKKYSDSDNTMFTIKFPVTYNMSQIQKQQQTLDNSKNKIAFVSDVEKIPFYQIMAYVPAATGLMVSRAINLPYTSGFLTGRFFNMLTYGLIIYFAMKKLKWGKCILMVIALFPTNLFLATNYSYDYFITALSLFGFSYLIGELQNRNELLSVKNATLILGSLMLGLGPKAIYFPMILLAFFIPKEKFANNKQYKFFRKFTITAILVMTAVFAFPFIFSGVGADDTRGGGDVNSIEQIKYILSNPLIYTKTLLGFLTKSYLRLDESSFYTNNLAYLGSGGYGILSIILLTAASFLDHNTEEKSFLTIRFRISTYVISFITICLISTALYIAFTAVGSETISGCSSRYLAPFVFPVVYCCGLTKIQSNYPHRVINLVIGGFSLFILYHTIWVQCISLYY